MTAQKFGDAINRFLFFSVEMDSQCFAGSQMSFQIVTIIGDLPDHIERTLHRFEKAATRARWAPTRRRVTNALYSSWQDLPFGGNVKSFIDEPRRKPKRTISDRSTNNFDSLVRRNVEPLALYPFLAQQGVRPMLDRHWVGDFLRPAQFELAGVADLQQHQSFGGIISAADFRRSAINFRNNVYRHENAPLFRILNISESRIIGILENREFRKINYFPRLCQPSCRFPEARTQHLV
jgi:hypothetical protein